MFKNLSPTVRISFFSWLFAFASFVGFGMMEMPDLKENEEGLFYNSIWNLLMFLPLFIAIISCKNEKGEKFNGAFANAWAITLMTYSILNYTLGVQFDTLILVIFIAVFVFAYVLNAKASFASIYVSFIMFYCLYEFLFKGGSFEERLRKVSEVNFYIEMNTKILFMVIIYFVIYKIMNRKNTNYKGGNYKKQKAAKKEKPVKEKVGRKPLFEKNKKKLRQYVNK